ncbi:MAG: ArnT family glycosyltransferase [Bryobacteraceae bacterium]
MGARVVFAALFVVVLAARLCHMEIVWVEEGYPSAAAVQIRAGKTLYSDVWFDKPPLAPYVYLLWGAQAGWLLRLAGALFVTLCCLLIYRFAFEVWGRREGLIAAGLLAFFLTFGIPSAVIPLAPDLLMIAPHIAAVYLAWRGQPFLAGAMAGVALAVNAKGLFVFAALLVFQLPRLLWLTAGFGTVLGLQVAWLAWHGALTAYWAQVWAWGMLYSRNTPVEQPLREGLLRTLNWAGFHAVLVIGAIWYATRERCHNTIRMFLWGVISLAAVTAGWRFFPRYYFHLLPVMTLAGARGLALLKPRQAAVLLLLLLAPLIRFGPRYLVLAQDLLAGRAHEWRDLAMHHDSRAAAELIRRTARPGDTLLVWGYRPEIFAYTRLAAGSAFLDSQPLTGVIADRHLVRSDVAAPALAAANRRELTQSRPTFIVDGLGPHNPDLAITAYEDLRSWLAEYEPIEGTGPARVYRRRIR